MISSLEEELLLPRRSKLLAARWKDGIYVPVVLSGALLCSAHHHYNFLSPSPPPCWDANYKSSSSAIIQIARLPTESKIVELD